MLNWLVYSGEVLQALLKISRSSLNSYYLNRGGEALDPEDSKIKKGKPVFSTNRCYLSVLCW